MAGLTVVVAASATLTAVHARAGGSHEGGTMQVGQTLHFVQGPGHSTGTFLMAGAANDSGTVDSTAKVTPISTTKSRIQGQEVLTGSKGLIRTSFSGVVTSTGNGPRVYVQGEFRITSGTGAYVSLRGEGDFYITVDASAGLLIRTDVGRASNEEN
ncbi:MAG: hypothetical protein M3019_02485 [Candidatus Dormibacteraeota bacterium]|nr:hypothetical protein [Candidatus Dormibacteraeota bacterium]